jgi:hypothetical protein
VRKSFILLLLLFRVKANYRRRIIEFFRLPRHILVNCFLFVLYLALAYIIVYEWHGKTLLQAIAFLWRTHAIELLTIYLAISGIVYANRHDREMKDQTDQVGVQANHLGTQVEHLGELNDSLSTGRTGPFPDYLNQIYELAKDAERLDILVDCLDFGSFFAPGIHDKVHDAICEAAKNKKRRVRILICSEIPEPFTGPSGQELGKQKGPEKLLRDYCKALQNDGSFRKWLKGSSNLDPFIYKDLSEAWFTVREMDADTRKWKLRPLDLNKHFKRCLDACDADNPIVPGIGEKDLITSLLQLRQLWFALSLESSDVHIRSLGGAEPMFFWIKYGANAAKGKKSRADARFTFANAARGPHQLGFKTRDRDLLEVFRVMFDEKWKEAEKNNPPWLDYLKRLNSVARSSPPQGN